jgi:hypothetical protein
MAPQGLTRLSILVPDNQQQHGALTKAGFADRAHLSYFEREIPVKQRVLTALRELGGRILPRDLWGSIAGMPAEKDLLDHVIEFIDEVEEIAAQRGGEPPSTTRSCGTVGSTT